MLPRRPSTLPTPDIYFLTGIFLPSHLADYSFITSHLQPSRELDMLTSAGGGMKCEGLEVKKCPRAGFN
ncbi:hypothetical protein E2C01_033711 [Portunus trituberculatus]|uniref:Uncharacterized protein n=1 Tax=Portunus trituberculatus TaxID=210409 RepID=A0A5B7F456_PORTR|nr:hypothetical protein [Portunus trituberculatus]